MKRWAIPCVVAAALGLWVATREEPAPRRSRPARTAVALPDEEAGVALGEALVHGRALADYDDARAALKRATSALGPPAEADRASWLPWADVVEALDRVVARPGLSVPPDLEEDDFTPLQDGAKAMVVRAWDRARIEGPEAGVADMLAVLVLGNRLTDASEEALQATVALYARQLALRELAELVEQWPEAGVLEAVRVGLLANPPPRGAMARVLEASCVREMDALSTELAKPGKVLAHLNLEEPVEALGVSPTVANTVVRAVMYDREDTEQFFQQRCDEVAAHLLLPPAVRPERIEDPKVDWRSFRNPLGRSLSTIGAWELRMANREERARAVQAVLTTAVAARLHQAEAGGPPASVAALVPRWLPSVPADPFRSGGVRIVKGVVESAAPSVEEQYTSGPTRIPI